MSVEAVSAPFASQPFQVVPVAVPARNQLPAPVAKAPPGRSMLKRVRRAMFPAYVLTTLASVGLAGVGAAVLTHGQSTALVKQHKELTATELASLQREREQLRGIESQLKTREGRLEQNEQQQAAIIADGVRRETASQRGALERQTSELDARKKALDGEAARLAADRRFFKSELDAVAAKAVAVHNAPERLLALRTQFAQIPNDDLVQLGRLADKAWEKGYAFVIETTELPLDKPRVLPGPHHRVASYDVARALALNGRLYVGKYSWTPHPQSSGQWQYVIEPKIAEPIMSYEGMRSYLNLFR